MILKNKGGNEFLQKIIGTKPTIWNYENESRLITDNFGKHHYDYRALKAIYFGLKMPDDEKLLLMDRLKGRGISYYQMMKKSNSYELFANPVSDLFPTDSPYLYSIAPIQDDAIPSDELKGKWKKYARYLSKAVEIQRRDPYCIEVCYTAFSVYDSKPGNPAIYVNYKFAAEGYMNRTFSTSEIDKLYPLISDL